MNEPLSPSDEPNSLRVAQLGQMLLATGVIALVSGLFLLPSYRASAEAAHQSVVAIQSSPTLAVIRGIHHWASALLIILGVVYVLAGLWKASHRHPYRTLWVGTLAAIGLAILFQLTGHLLPWDQQAVSTASIETGIAEGAPVIGTIQANFLRRGESVGPATLSLWYAAHVYFLPILYVGLGLFLFLRFRKAHTPVSKVGLSAVCVVLAVIGSLVAAPLGPGATPADYGSFAARPEWYILPLHTMLNAFQNIRPNLAFVGTMVIPGVVALFLVAMPWLERKPGRLGKSAAVILSLAFVALFGLSFRDLAPPVGNQTAAVSVSDKPSAISTLDQNLVLQGRKLFVAQGCDMCHKIKGEGGKAGPELTAEATRHADIEWQILHLKSPAHVTPGSTMPPFKTLSDADLKALASYVLSKK